MTRIQSLAVTLLCLLSALTTRGAQGYGTPDVERFHASTVYYLTLQDAAGKSINSRFATMPQAIGAFVGGELRGTASWQPIGDDRQVLVMRVWGDDADPATISIHLLDGLLEYELAEQPFGRGSEATFGEPSKPIALTFTAVTSLQLSPSTVSVLLGGRQTVSPVLMPQEHSRLLTELTYSYTAGGTSGVFSVDEAGIVTGQAVGQGLLTVRAMSGSQEVLAATASVAVLTQSVGVTGIRNDMPSLTIDRQVGESFRLAFTLLPENATDRRVDYRISDYDVLTYAEDEQGQTTFTCIGTGTSTITVTSADNSQVSLVYTVNVTQPVAPVITFPASITLSRLRDTALTLTHTNAAQSSVQPALVGIVIADGPHGWTAATATGRGLTWSLRGRAVGQYDYYVTYDGQRMTSSDGKPTGRLTIPAEISYSNGWDWISIYAPLPFALTNPATGDYLPALNIDSQNRIIEIRSQQAALYNDPTLGLFGDITSLTPADGAYKIKSNYEDANAAAKTFSITLPAQTDPSTVADMMPAVGRGYTWIGYPHEQDHSLATLQRYLSKRAAKGDLIVGQQAFIEYDGTQWVGSLKNFQAGRGYLYYTARDTTFRLDWGDYYLPQEQTAPAAPAAPVWRSAARRHASTMTVVASLGRQVDAGRYSIGAFVGDECRGWGEAAGDDGRFFISVGGETGETVSFMLYDREHDTYTDLDGTLRFTMAAGSIERPFVLHVSDATLGIDTPKDAGRFAITLSGQQLVVNGCSSQPRIGIYNLAGRLLLASRQTVTDVSHLPQGVYVVSVSDGTAEQTFKITK